MTTSSQRLSTQTTAMHAAVKPAVVPDKVDITGIVKTYGRGQEIFGQGERADHVYKVVRGAVRCFKTLSDGRRQICDFALPGDVFGLELGGDHGMSAEAVAESAIVVARRGVVLENAADPLAAARALCRLAMADLDRSRDHILTLGRRGACERVVAFLLEVADRTGGAAVVELPMSRQDMADYLGLTIETVSRTLTHLEGQGLIRLRCCRSIELNDRRALRALCE
jgi:CRP/FNR family nitrogen fixation transcriptional regulator